MPAIKNIAIAGAGGYLGSAVLENIAANPSFTATVLRRPGSKSTYPSTTKVIDVDYESVEDLTAALKGQDALVLTVGSESIPAQLPFIDAAAAAGVYRVIPSDFGSDMLNEHARKLVVFGGKLAVEARILEKVESTQLTYTRIFNGAFLPFSFNGFLFNKKEPFVIGDGETYFSATSIDTVSKAIVSVLSKPEETENKVLRIEDVKLSQNRIHALAKEVDPSWTLEPKKLDINVLQAEAGEKRAQGIYNMETLVSDIWQSLTSPEYGSNFETVDNELLGVQPKGEKYVIEELKKALKE